MGARLLTTWCARRSAEPELADMMATVPANTMAAATAPAIMPR